VDRLSVRSFVPLGLVGLWNAWSGQTWGIRFRGGAPMAPPNGWVSLLLLAIVAASKRAARLAVLGISGKRGP